jgi:hypothetical protein
MHRRLATGVMLGAAAVVAAWILAPWLFPHTIKTHANTASIAIGAVALLLGPAALGMMAAIAACKLDPRIYDGADVERLIGVAPIGELPDFAEAPGENGEVLLLRLANEIAQSSKKGQMRRCVLTGTGHGAGVTTVALRMKQSLDILDRPAMLVDATGAPHAAVAPSAAALRSAGLAAGPAPHGEDGKRRDALILTDAEPIAMSPDTEFLVRFADCVLVVIESGVTTRRELHRTANCVKKLNVSTVRFVVNRVKQSHWSLRLGESIGAVGVAPGQFAAAVHRALAGRRHQDEEISRPHRAAAEAGTAAKIPENPDAAATKNEAPEPTAWNAPGIPPWLSEAIAQIEADEALWPASATSPDARGSQQSPDPDQAPAADSAEPAGQPLEALPLKDHSQGKEPDLSEAADMLFSMELNLPAQENGPARPAAVTESAQPDSQEAGKKPSRLSGLRGIVGAADLRALNQPKPAEATRWPIAERQPGVPSSLIEALTETPGRLTGLKGLVTAEDLKELNQGRPQTPQAGRDGDQGQVAPAQNTTAPELRIVEAACPPGPDEGKTKAPEPAAAERSNGQSEGVPAKPPKPALPGRDARFDEVQILPSKRGQYGRKI